MRIQGLGSPIKTTCVFDLEVLDISKPIDLQGYSELSAFHQHTVLQFIYGIIQRGWNDQGQILCYPNPIHIFAWCVWYQSNNSQLPAVSGCTYSKDWAPWGSTALYLLKYLYPCAYTLLLNLCFTQHLIIGWLPGVLLNNSRKLTGPLLSLSSVLFK